MSTQRENINIQRLVVAVGLVLFAIKFLAWYITGSVAILTDALESTVNVVASFVGLYSLVLSAKPRDAEHPYGHGKVEFISAGVEGALIAVAGIFIIYHAFKNLLYPREIGQLDFGIMLTGIAAAVNFGVGTIAVKRGKKNNSLALAASGKHLISDTYTTLGVIAGLLLVKLTGQMWIDSATALVFALLIIFTGYKIMRSSIAGIMDEANKELIGAVVKYLDDNRRENWVDIHNLRIIQYGSVLHFDFHLTLPWYFNLHEAHREMENIDRLIKEKFGESVEMFVHTDACLDFSCKICTKQDCPVRKAAFEEKIAWGIENVSSNRKHGQP